MPGLAVLALLTQITTHTGSALPTKYIALPSQPSKLCAIPLTIVSAGVNPRASIYNSVCG